MVSETIDGKWIRKNAEYIWNISHKVARQMVGYLDAEDVAQETFLKVVRGIDGFKQGKRIEPWVRRIAYNTCVEYRRKNPKHFTVYEMSESIEPTTPLEIISRVEDEERLARKINSALSSLPPKQREMVNIVYIEGEKYKVASERMGIPLGTVKSGLSKAIEKIGRQIKRKMIDECVE